MRQVIRFIPKRKSGWKAHLPLFGVQSVELLDDTGGRFAFCLEFDPEHRTGARVI